MTKHFTISADLLRDIARRAREIDHDVCAAVMDAGEDHDQARAFTIADLERAVEMFKQMDPPPVIRVHDMADARRLANAIGADSDIMPYQNVGAFAGLTLRVSSAVPQGQAIMLQEHRDGREPDLYVVQLNSED